MRRQLSATKGGKWSPIKAAIRLGGCPCFARENQRWPKKGLSGGSLVTKGRRCRLDGGRLVAGWSSCGLGGGLKEKEVEKK